MKHQEHLSRPRTYASKLYEVLHDFIVRHVVPRLIQEVGFLLGKAVDVAGLGAGHATSGDACLVGGQHGFRGHRTEVLDQAFPNSVGGQHGDLLADDGPDECLEKVVSTGDAVRAKRLHRRSKNFILEKVVVGGRPPIRDAAYHEVRIGDEVLNPCFKAEPCERNFWRT